MINRYKSGPGLFWQFWFTEIVITSLISCQPKINQDKFSISYPNIVLILSDDQGWGDLSATGNSNIQTPNIDRIGQEGVFFNHFYVSPVCSPTRAELLTGRYHPRCGVYSTSAGGERLDLDETTFAQLFQQAGYKTAAYGKWHNGMQYPYHPNARGFDDFYGFCSGHWGNYFSPMLEHNGQLVKGKGFIIDDLTNHAIDFIKKNKANPFLLYLPYNTPHSPMQVPEEYWSRFQNDSLVDRHRDPEKENLDFTRAALSLCENIDWNVGRVLSTLQEQGLEEKTIVIYLSDNGPNSWRWNEGMKGRKGSTDEGGVRSPFFIRWKGTIPSERKVEQIAADIDLFPTLLDLAGINQTSPKPLDGESLKPLLMAKANSWPERLIFSHWREHTSVRSQQYRLDAQNRLFDMMSDPGQRTDVAGQHQEVQQRLVRARQDWESSVLAELPKVDTRRFPIGDPEYSYTQLPARDGVAHGNIKRSNRWPNCSFYTQWTSLNDSITWNTEVLAEGDYDATLYYTCPQADVGATFRLSLGNHHVDGKITEAHNPPLRGMEHDKVPRIESYVKDFKPLDMGTIHLSKGKGLMTLRATQIPGHSVMDFRLLMLTRRKL